MSAISPKLISTSAIAVSAVANPFLHCGPDRFYNPLTDRSLMMGETLYAELVRVWSGLATPSELSDASRDALAAGGWTVAAGEDPSRRYYLKYVSLEAHTVCNQSCYFCPVSVAPRDDYFMPTEFFERIVGELGPYRATLEAVFLMNYNEPTLDKRFVDQCRTIMAAGLPAAVLSNGSGLTPQRIDALVEAGPLKFLSINLSTLDREKYGRDRGADQLEIVLRHLDYAKDRRVAERMDMVVLGTGDARHKDDYRAIKARFAGSLFDVKYFVVMDRAGYLPIGLSLPVPLAKLRGCENVGSRPLQHLHITPRGKCVLCCEDYDEKYIVGDLNDSSVGAVLAGPSLGRLRRWVYGIEEAPADFMCRKCIFALGE